MLSKIFHSERLVIKNKKNTFEGWYFRHDGSYKFSLIVGVSHNTLDPHCFIQYIDKNLSHYFRFEKDKLEFSNDGMSIKIDKNIMSLSGIDLKLANKDISLDIKVGYLSHELFKKTVLAPSAMGIFSYLPMQCNHAIISLKHSVSGTIQINNERFYADGYGYIEKDFGKNFPQNYVWLHALNKTTSIMLAVAYPLVLNMKGFLCFIQHEGKQYNFSKYTLAKLKEFKVDKDNVEALLTHKKSSLSLKASLNEHKKPLVAPSKTALMDNQIFESIVAPFFGSLTLNGKHIDLSDIKTCALEIVV